MELDVQAELAAQFELLDDRFVAREFALLQVVQQFAAATRHLEEAAARVEILPVRA